MGPFVSPPNRRCFASPGPIAPGETLAFGLYSPNVFDPETGLIKPDALGLEKLTGGKKGKTEHLDACGVSTGLSVSRLGVVGGQEQLDEQVDAIASRVGKDGIRRVAEGMSVINSADVTSILALGTKGPPAFVVIDDGCDCFSSHAVVRNANGIERAALRGPRDELLKLLNHDIRRRKVVRETDEPDAPV